MVSDFITGFYYTVAFHFMSYVVYFLLNVLDCLVYIPL